MARKAFEVSPGLKLDFVMPVAVTSGQGVLIGGMFGIAITDGAIGERVTLGIGAVWEDVAKTTAEAWAECQLIYWDNTNKRFTTTAGANKRVGVARKAALAADAFGSVRLDGVSLA